MPQVASLTQNMVIKYLKTKVSDNTHNTQQDQLKNAPPKSTVRKLMQPTPSVAWTWGLLGQSVRGGGGGHTCSAQHHCRYSRKPPHVLPPFPPLNNPCTPLHCNTPQTGAASMINGLLPSIAGLLLSEGEGEGGGGFERGGEGGGWPAPPPLSLRSKMYRSIFFSCSCTAFVVKPMIHSWRVAVHSWMFPGIHGAVEKQNSRHKCLAFHCPGSMWRKKAFCTDIAPKAKTQCNSKLHQCSSA